MPAAPLSLRQRIEPWFFIMPSVVVLLAIGIYPTIYTAIASLQIWVMGMEPPSFGGIQNYVHAFGSSDFIDSVLRTLVLILITLPIELLFGLMIALALDSTSFPLLRRLLQICLVIPIAITPSVVGLLTQLMFNDQLGIINYFLHGLGLHGVDWLGRPTAAFGTVVIVQVWEATPFVALVLSAALSTVPKDIDEAAMLETERWWPRFRDIQLPFMWPGITAALVFQTAFTIKEFDMIYSIERGGPGTATETAVMQIERMAFRGFDVGLASAESILMLILSIILARVYIKAFYRELE
jgi:multiple sugar transport system permease protein